MRPIDADAITYCHYDLDNYHSFRAIEEDDIAEMPTLTLDDLRPKGRWVMRGGKRYCSHCGERACVTRDKEDFWYTKGTQFCPDCGADMRGGGEDA